MIRWVLAGAFYRWGLVGLACALLLLAAGGWWLVSATWFLISGSVYVFGVIAGVIYLALLLGFIRRLRSRRRDDHLLSYGRRRSPWD